MIARIIESYYNENVFQCERIPAVKDPPSREAGIQQVLAWMRMPRGGWGPSGM